MKTILWTLTLLAVLAASLCEEKAIDPEKSDKKEAIVLVETEPESDQSKPKRQTAEGRVVGGTQHFQYGASPGHYLLRTNEANAEPDAEYLSLLKQLEGGLQPVGPQARATQQQFVLQRQPQPEYAGQLVSREPKLLQFQPTSGKRPVYQPNQLVYQQAYQSSRPLVLRPSQAVKASPVQGFYTNQGYVPNSNGHSLHEARVQAALSVADDKPGSPSGSHSAFQYSPRPQSPLGDSSFEKELAQLVAANQAAELKVKPQLQYQQYQQPQQHYQQQQHQQHQQQQQQQQHQQQQKQQQQQQQLQQQQQQQPQQQQQHQQQLQYVQRIQQAPQKHTYIISSSPKPKQYSHARPETQGVKYVAPSVIARAKSPQLPQQYLIETTKPQAVQSKPVTLKARPQYIQAAAEEPKYYSFQTYQDNLSPMKVVAAPQLQQAQIPLQYKQFSQKEDNEPAAPTYLQYYQTAKPQAEEPSNDKLEQYYRFNAPKAQASTPSSYQEQPEFVPRYNTQLKPEEPTYIPYKAPTPQQTHQFSPEDQTLIQSLLGQSAQKSNQGLSGFATSKTASTVAKPQFSSVSPHSSIFVSKSLTPKKNSHSVTIEPPTNAEPEEEIQTVRLPPPKNNKVYTQEEFQALVAAGYSVTPVPVTDDEESQPNFSPAPVNYPGHSKYQAFATAAPEQTHYKQPSEAYAEATQAPRKRKQRRPTVRPQYRYQDNQAESESQSKLAYAAPEQAEESVNYGMRKSTKSRGQANRGDSFTDDSQS